MNKLAQGFSGYQFRWRHLAYALLALLVFLFFQTPMGHGMLWGEGWWIFNGFFSHFFQWVVVIVFGGMILVGLVYALVALNENNNGCITSLALVLIGSVGLFVGLAWHTVQYGKGLVSQPYEQVTVERLDTRWSAYEVAREELRQRRSEATRKVGDIDSFLTEDGHIAWRGPWVPNGLGNVWFGTTSQLLENRDSRDVVIEQPFTCGEGMQLTDSVKWALIHNNYAVNYPEIFYAQDENGTWFAVAPMIGYRLKFPAMVPYWKGVSLVSPDCQVYELTPEQATATPFLQDTPIYPEQLVRLEVENWHYRFGGISNHLFRHVGQVNIPDIPLSDNSQPYFGVADTGAQWVVAADSWGADNKALSTLFLHDVDSPIMRVVDMRESGVIGIEAAISAVKSDQPTVSWKESYEGDGTFLVLESRPAIRDNQFYWIATQATDDFMNGIPVMAVNGNDQSQVTKFCNPAEFYAWMEGAQPTQWTGSCPDYQTFLPGTGDPLEDLTDDQLRQEKESATDRLYEILREMDLRGLQNMINGIFN